MPASWRRERVEEEIARRCGSLRARRGDDAGLAMAYRLLGWSAGTACRFGDCGAAEPSWRSSTPGGRATSGRSDRATTGFAGARPPRADERRRGDRPLRVGPRRRRRATGSRRATCSRSWRGCTRCREHSITRASSSAERASLLSELGLDLDVARADMEAWRVEMLAGNVEAAEAALRRSYDALVARGETYLRSTVAGLLAETMLERGGPLEEARAARPPEPGARERRRHRHPGAVASRARPRPRAARRARRGRAHHPGGARAARADRRPVLRLEAELDLGDVLVAAGRNEDARSAYEAARELAERKGGVVLLGAVIRRLEGLDAAPA